MDQLLAIRVFARVVESGAFTRAADSLDMPIATVSKLVRSLEQHLGIRLLQRTTRSVSVTPDGAAYYERTARVLRDLEDIDASFSTAQQRPRGRLRIDIGSSTATRVLIPLLPAFTARYPDIRVDLGVSDRQIDLVRDNVDCVIRGGKADELSLVARMLGSTPFATCATPSYLERYGTPNSPAELREKHRIVNYVSAATGRVIPMRFERNGENIVIGSPNSVGINESNAHFAAGLAGLGIIQTFNYVARDALEAGTLVPILKSWQPAPYPFFLLYSPDRHMSARLRAFIEWLGPCFAAALA